MDYDDHCINLGRLWGSLQSLEVTLRIFLTQANPSENHITNSDTFGTLVGKYNGRLSNEEQSLHSVDTSVVDIRNALAHGLVSGRMGGFPLTLLHKNLRAVMTRGMVRRAANAGARTNRSNIGLWQEAMAIALVGMTRN